MARKALHGNVVATEEGEKMGQNRFQLDEEKADLDKDGQVSSYERARGEAVQKAMGEEQVPGLMMGGMMMDSDPFAPFQVVLDVDEASGNHVPAGSKDEEVRDDIPALLSEGEYVVPADVVRYHGLKTFEELRCEAKHALGLMAMHDRISMVDEDTKEPVEYDIEEKDAPKVEKAEVKVVEAESGTDIQTGYYQLQYMTDPVTGELKMAYVDPVTGEQISEEEYEEARASRFKPQTVLEREVYEGIDAEEEAEEAVEEAMPACPPGYRRDPYSNQCVPIVVDTGGDGPEDTPQGRGTLGLTEVEVDDIFSELSPEYKELMDQINQPPGMVDMLVPGALAVKTVVNNVRKQFARTDVRDLIREGKNIGITPSTDVKDGFDTSYADWRGNIDTYTAASIAISEKEAQNVTSGGGDWRESQYGSKAEADAVARSGWGSADVFDTIDDQFSAIDRGPTQQQIDDYNRAEAARQAAQQNRFSASDGTDNDAQAGVGNQGESSSSPSSAYGDVSSYSSGGGGSGGYSGGGGHDPSDYGDNFYAKGGMPARKNTPKVAMIKYSKGNN